MCFFAGHSENGVWQHYSCVVWWINGIYVSSFHRYLKAKKFNMFKVVWFRLRVCRVKLEVDQTTGSTNSLEADPATGSTYHWVSISCVQLYICFSFLSWPPRVNKLLDASPSPSSHLRSSFEQRLLRSKVVAPFLNLLFSYPASKVFQIRTHLCSLFCWGSL